MKIALLFLACVSAFGQDRWAASFAQQGQEVLRGALGRRVSGIAVWSGQVCAGAAALELPAGVVLQAMHGQGLVVFDGLSLEALLVRTDARSTASILAAAGEGITLGGAVVASSGVIQMKDQARQKWGFGLAFGAGFFHWVSGKAKARKLNPDQVRSMALPAALALPAGGCWRGSLLGLPSTLPAITFRVDR